MKQVILPIFLLVLGLFVTFSDSQGKMVALALLDSNRNNYNISRLDTTTDEERYVLALVLKNDKIKVQIDHITNAYHMRLDLVPNLVATVQGSVSADSGTIEAVVSARSRAADLTLTPEVLKDSVLFAKFEQVQDGLSGALSRLIVMSDQYPELQSQENFQMLMNQIEGNENRIRLECNLYNEAVKEFNSAVSKIEANSAAKIYNITQYQYFR